jgi:superfamily I DNA/RNA helicase/RecB family exonuclease
MPRYQLAPHRHEQLAAPQLDRFQRAVVEHDRGPLLVLAGPGTGKTTTLVEAVVDRIERGGVAPESVLALTFSRKAAEQLRDRVTARLGRTMATSLSCTFHSFAYSLVRAFGQHDLYAQPLRLLSAPEQDVQLRELLDGAGDVGGPEWPPSLRTALGTRGFARELQALLARAREKGLDPEDLARLGKEEGRADWQAAARFMEDYLRTLDFKSALDYPELVHRAVLLAERPDVREALRARYSWVFVDEYQDTDPRQVALLQALAGDGRNLVAVGDPDQSIYAFRGAEVRGILDFPEAFRTGEGHRAPVVALRTTRRFGPTLLAASRSVARGIPTRGAIDADLFRRFRDPEPAPEATDGTVEVRLFSTPRAETEHIADILRRAHLEDGLPWSQMAVLVRSGAATIPPLRRALHASGIPVEVAGDELPLADEPSVAPLLSCLRAVAAPDRLTTDAAHGLLSSPLGGLDATEIRWLGRELRAADRDAHREERPPLPSAQLVRAALLDPGLLADLEGPVARKARDLALLLTRAARDLRAGATAEEVLWTLWDGSVWKRHLRAAVDRGGAAARRAHRDLDAVCALFEVAARAEEKQGHTSVESFLAELEAQQIPGDTLAERGVRGESVRLLTAHRSKGLEWELVVVAGVQEHTWPNLQQRGSLLGWDRIGSDGVVEPASRAALLADERRLFYVAVTRARRRLVATAVQSAEDDGDQPSRFLGELGVAAPAVQGRPRRPLSLPGLVAELRRTLSDDTASDALRCAAATRLARLATAVDRNHEQLVPQADPGTWWGVRRRSHAPRPLRPADQPVEMSASALDGLLSCPVRWFLDREAAGGSAQSSAQGFGLVVHALADRVAKGELSEVDELVEHVDRIWDDLDFETPWARERQRGHAHDVIRRFVAWHNRPDARTYLASEEAISAVVELPDGEKVALRGFVDRLEMTADGTVVVVDFKTTKRKPSREEVLEHPQLGLYQLAVERGAVDHLLDGAEARSGGAELVLLRQPDGELPKVQRQAPQEPGADGHRLVEVQLMNAAEVVRSETLTARENRYCGYCEFQTICPVKGSGTVLS